MKGQAFAVMKMAIGAVFAVALLTLIYFLTQNINPPTTAYLESSHMITEALNAKGQCIGRTIVTYKENEVLTPSVYIAASKLDSVTVNAPLHLIGASGAFKYYNGDCCSVRDSAKLPLSVKCDLTAAKNCNIYLGVPNCIVPAV